MSNTAQVFQEKSTEKAFDVSHRQIINHNIGKYDAAVVRGLSRLANLEASKKKAHVIKWKVMENLDKLLPEFESNFQRRGGKVLWANTAEEARQEILNIIKKSGAKTVIKSKSMVTEEIHLNEFLEKHKVEALESDLGEYIVQLLDQKPYHIVTPAMHLSKEAIADLFHEKFGTELNATPEELTQKARELLREKYTTADIGITGANFLLADTGSIAVTENEGNARLSTTFPKIHIAVVGIEKLIPSMADLDLFWPLLSTHGTGQNLTVYNTILSGPRQENESDGPEEMYVILLDNGRTNILAKPRQRESLYCIRCGACLNACPVYRNIGGHAYGSTYSGPIGKVISPNLESMEAYGHLADASALCGACTETCPVNIRLHDLILDNRHEEVRLHVKLPREKRVWALWRRAMLNRAFMNVPSFLKRFFVSTFLRGAWGERREMPAVERESFNKLWRKGAV